MSNHLHLSDIVKKLKRHPHNSDQPDLTTDEQIVNQRSLIKFWIDHATTLEKENIELRAQLAKFSKNI